MVIGTVIAGLNLGMLVYFHLISPTDWAEHRSLWIICTVVPYVVVLGGHGLWRLALAPSQLHADQENRLSESERLRIDAESRIYEGRPRISLEAIPLSGKDWLSAHAVFFIQNIGERAAREIRFEPIVSKSGIWRLRLETVGALIPNHRSPLGFAVDCNEREMRSNDYIAHYLRHFCGDGKPEYRDTFVYPISATFYDVNDVSHTENWVLECVMPQMSLKVTPVVKSHQ